MSSKRQTTMAKMKREQSVRERRVRKQEKKEERKRAAAELKAMGGVAPILDPETGLPLEGLAEAPAEATAEGPAEAGAVEAPDEASVA